MLYPLGFVSEHSETLVELDIDYRQLAKRPACRSTRVPTVGTHPLFIAGLATGAAILPSAGYRLPRCHGDALWPPAPRLPLIAGLCSTKS